MLLFASLLITATSLSLGSTREFTDKELSYFPKLFHLDHYERCLAKPGGLYCLGTFDLTPAERPHAIYELMNEYSKNTFHHYNRTRIHRGYCVSDRCPTTHDRNASLRFERCMNQWTEQRKLRASLRLLQYCRTHDEVKNVQPRTNEQSLFMRVLHVLIVLNIIGTIYDSYTGDSPHKIKFLTAFSIPRNWRKLTIIYEGGDPRLSALTPLQGFRVIALGFTTYAHASVIHFGLHTTNPEELEDYTKRFDGVFLANGTSLIQVFVMLTSFLTVYNLLIISEKQAIGIKALPLCIMKRLIRIVPVNLLVVGFAATWWIHTRDGPLVSSVIGQETEACKNKFWSHMFFYNNMVEKAGYCVLPTWFLPVDMHLYILTCALTLVMWRHRSTAIKLYTFLFFATSAVIGVIVYFREYKSMVFMKTPEEIRRLFRDSESFTEFYISTWGALPACFLGMILGHIQYEIDVRKIDMTKYKWFLYLYYAAFILTWCWALTGIPVQQINSAVFQAAHLALDRSVFCIFVAITFIAMINMDVTLGKIFSWRGWHAMSRMSLTLMLLHWCLNLTIATRPVAYHTSILDTMVDWVATNFLTYLIAVPITILIEIPIRDAFGSLLF